MNKREAGNKLGLTEEDYDINEQKQVEEIKAMVEKPKTKIDYVIIPKKELLKIVKENYTAFPIARDTAQKLANETNDAMFVFSCSYIAKPKQAAQKQLDELGKQLAANHAKLTTER